MKSTLVLLKLSQVMIKFLKYESKDSPNLTKFNNSLELKPLLKLEIDSSWIIFFKTGKELLILSRNVKLEAVAGIDVVLMLMLMLVVVALLKLSPIRFPSLNSE
ncbi:hypothetical protein WICPIJ_007928 [Wickerhamomyces pijperi]|uniref:Uncharacterized protein n=1 Tax=Wickerhamomyces pijperi TaxID=599730 RepID=A0A9P8TIT0_WICPI|nr:hypothetical protein WICPIJ_007928 [Wickerhamomyces pijperi]